MFASVWFSLGWYLMARMEETLHLQVKHFVEQGSDPKYHGEVIPFVILTFRKTNQADPRNSKLNASGRVCSQAPFSSRRLILLSILPVSPLRTGNRYQVHQSTDPEEYPAYPIPYIKRWRAHVEEQTRIPSSPEHYLLPLIGSGGKIDVHQPMPQSTWKILFNRTIDNSKIYLKYPRAHFSTHGIRRGAAQWRSNYAPKKWGMHIIKWWGGWSAGESVSRLFEVRSRIQVD